MKQRIMCSVQGVEMLVIHETHFRKHYVHKRCFLVPFVNLMLNCKEWRIAKLVLWVFKCHNAFHKKKIWNVNLQALDRRPFNLSRTIERNSAFISHSERCHKQPRARKKNMWIVSFSIRLDVAHSGWFFFVCCTHCPWMFAPLPVMKVASKTVLTAVPSALMCDGNSSSGGFSFSWELQKEHEQHWLSYHYNLECLAYADFGNFLWNRPMFSS